jgi:hypothetical protein
VGQLVGGGASPAVVLPGEPVAFKAEVAPGEGGEGIRWTGGGEPADGEGPAFTTQWSSGGTYDVTATCGSSRITLIAQVCPVDQLLNEASAFYGPSVDMSRVTVKTSSLIVDGRPWTDGNTIRFPKPADVGSCPDLETMIHELAHVWEHQTGQTQILSGAVEQLGHVLVPGYNPYDFGGSDGVHGATRLRDFNKESQAQIIENCWRVERGFDVDTAGRPFTEQYVADLRRLVEGAGIGRKAPAGAASTVGGVVDSIAGGIVKAVLALFGQ